MNRPRAVDVVVYGGLVAATLDIVNALLFWKLYSGTPPTRILQAISAGLLGDAAFTGGAATAMFGLTLHYVIACGMAFVYWIACLRLPALVRHPAPAGLVYGAITWVAMNHVIVPLSRAKPPPFIPAWFADGVLAHLILIGLVLAFAAHWSARRS